MLKKAEGMISIIPRPKWADFHVLKLKCSLNPKYVYSEAISIFLAHARYMKEFASADQKQWVSALPKLRIY